MAANSPEQGHIPTRGAPGERWPPYNRQGSDARRFSGDGECPRMTPKYFEDRAEACRQMAERAGDRECSAVSHDIAVMFEEIAQETRTRRLIRLAEASALET